MIPVWVVNACLIRGDTSSYTVATKLIRTSYAGGTRQPTGNPESRLRFIPGFATGYFMNTEVVGIQIEIFRGTGSGSTRNRGNDDL